MRPDLLALTDDDLAALTNRGTVKRARRELDEAAVTGTLAAADGDVSAAWLDGPTSRVPKGVALKDGRCSCPGAVRPCLHLVRLVLLFQKEQVPEASPAAAAVPPAPAGPWDPGAISDELLASHFRGPQFAKLKAAYQKGVLAELVRAAKPTCRLHQPAAVVRFLVPGDPRYTRCDCADAAPCGHVALAVWAFRELDAKLAAGVVSTGGKAAPAPPELLAEFDAILAGLAEDGFSAAPPAWADRVARAEARGRDAGLVWPAEVLSDLGEQYRRYAARDALFAPDRVPDLAGELLARRDAIAADTGAVPQGLVRGAKGDAAGAVGRTKFVGLGVGVAVGRRGAELVAYLQDAGTGAVAVVGREFPDPGEGAEPKPFAELARYSVVKGSSFANLGRGLLLIDGAKRTAGLRLALTRANASVQPQAFDWAGLRPPVLVDDYAKLHARLAALPPAAVRPRRAGEDFHVLPVTAVDAARFDAASQCVSATLHDAAGRVAYLAHPFTSRGRGGTEALLAKLADPAAKLAFVAGPVRRGPHGLTVSPTAVVFDTPAGRVGVLPWADESTGPAAAGDDFDPAPPALPPLTDAVRQIQLVLEDVFVLGLRRADGGTAKRWRELHRTLEAGGLARLGGLVSGVANELEQKTRTVRWDPAAAAAGVLSLAAVTRMARDMG